MFWHNRFAQDAGHDRVVRLIQQYMEAQKLQTGDDFQDSFDEDVDPDPNDEMTGTYGAPLGTFNPAILVNSL